MGEDITRSGLAKARMALAWLVACAMLLAACAFMFAEAPAAYASDDLQTQSLRIAPQASTYTGKYDCEYAVLKSDGYIHHADANGNVINRADWSGSEWWGDKNEGDGALQTVRWLFIDSDVTTLADAKIIHGTALRTPDPGFTHTLKTFQSSTSKVGMSNLEHVVFLLDANGRSSCANIPDHAFYGQNLLQEVRNFDKTGFITVPKYAFKNCDRLVGIALPDSVKSIGLDAFSGCSALSDVNFGTGVVEIESKAFQDCVLLGIQGRALDLPEPLTKIGSSAFSGCTQLHTVILRGQHATVTLGGSAFNKTNLTNVFVYNYFLGNYADKSVTATWDNWRDKIRGFLEISRVEPGSVYDGTPKTPAVSATWMGAPLDAANYAVSYRNNVDAGTATAVATGLGAYALRTEYTAGTFNDADEVYTLNATRDFAIAQASNPLKAKAKKKAVRVKRGKKVANVKVSGARGKVSYSCSSKKFSVDKKGRVTAKSSAAKKPYKVKVTVTAAGNANYKSATVTVKFTVRVR